MLLALLKVAGHSMVPDIKNNSLVIVSSIPYLLKAPSEGDIVAFKINDKIMIKRIMEVKTGQYFVEGDNKADSLKIGWIKRKDILGKIIK